MNKKIGKRNLKNVYLRKRTELNKPSFSACVEDSDTVNEYILDSEANTSYICEVAEA